MPIPEDDILGPGLDRRLKAALDEVVPPSPMLASARYRMGAARTFSRAWRFAPVLVAVGAAGAVITATAATGSPNPAIWKDRATTVLQSVGHLPHSDSSPKATKSPEPKESPEDKGTAPGRPRPSSSQKPEPTESPEPTERPAPAPSPEPSDQPEPSSTPDSSSGGDSEPSPTPSSTDGH